MTNSHDEISTFIEETRQTILNSKSTAPPMNSLKEETEQSGGLPIIRDLGRTWALKSDLTVVLLHTEPWDHQCESNNPIVITNEAMRCYVIAIAAIKYPELNSTNFQRPDDTNDCPFCHLHAHQTKEGGCRACEGLGWIPRDWKVES
ncbi:MAG: hypothetical protein Q8T09_17230 [Candidatus Melainabacteria bacterium]|nr:hypothetical protein [Candidatus Melainabacteria bacterium]